MPYSLSIPTIDGVSVVYQTATTSNSADDEEKSSTFEALLAISYNGGKAVLKAIQPTGSGTASYLQFGTTKTLNFGPIATASGEALAPNIPSANEADSLYVNNRQWTQFPTGLLVASPTKTEQLTGLTATGDGSYFVKKSGTTYSLSSYTAPTYNAGIMVGNGGSTLTAISASAQGTYLVERTSTGNYKLTSYSAPTYPTKGLVYSTGTTTTTTGNVSNGLYTINVAGETISLESYAAPTYGTGIVYGSDGTMQNITPPDGNGDFAISFNKNTGVYTLTQIQAATYPDGLLFAQSNVLKSAALTKTGTYNLSYDATNSALSFVSAIMAEPNAVGVLVSQDGKNIKSITASANVGLYAVTYNDSTYDLKPMITSADVTQKGVLWYAQKVASTNDVPTINTVGLPLYEGNETQTFALQPTVSGYDFTPINPLRPVFYQIVRSTPISIALNYDDPGSTTNNTSPYVFNSATLSIPSEYQNYLNNADDSSYLIVDVYGTYGFNGTPFTVQNVDSACTNVLPVTTTNFYMVIILEPTAYTDANYRAICNTGNIYYFGNTGDYKSGYATPIKVAYNYQYSPKLGLDFVNVVANSNISSVITVCGNIFSDKNVKSNYPISSKIGVALDSNNNGVAFGTESDLFTIIPLNNSLPLNYKEFHARMKCKKQYIASDTMALYFIPCANDDAVIKNANNTFSITNLTVTVS